MASGWPSRSPKRRPDGRGFREPGNLLSAWANCFRTPPISATRRRRSRDAAPAEQSIREDADKAGDDDDRDAKHDARNACRDDGFQINRLAQRERHERDDDGLKKNKKLLDVVVEIPQYRAGQNRCNHVSIVIHGMVRDPTTKISMSASPFSPSQHDVGTRIPCGHHARAREHAAVVSSSPHDISVLTRHCRRSSID